MKRLLIAVCLAGIAAAQSSSDLVGRWRSVETSKGGIGAMYDFFADGTAHFSPGAVVPMRYGVEGDQLTTYPVDGPSFTLSFKDADHMRMSVKGASEDYTRLGQRRDAGNKLLGEWTCLRSIDGNMVAVHWIFRADTTALMMVRFRTETGRYELRDGRLSATFGAHGGLMGPVTLADDVLTITHEGKTTRLMRY